MTRAELIALAREKAAAHGLDPKLVCAICEQESSWNPWATRYEPAFFAKYVAPLYIVEKIRSATEAYARGFSWGLMQVMGQTAREHGFDAPFLAELCNPDVGLDIGCRVLARKLAAAEGNVQGALLLWNGGGDRDYPGQVLSKAEKYQAKEPAVDSVR